MIRFEEERVRKKNCLEGCVQSHTRTCMECLRRDLWVFLPLLGLCA